MIVEELLTRGLINSYPLYHGYISVISFEVIEVPPVVPVRKRQGGGVTGPSFQQKSKKQIRLTVLIENELKNFVKLVESDSEITANAKIESIRTINNNVLQVFITEPSIKNKSISIEMHLSQ